MMKKATLHSLGFSTLKKVLASTLTPKTLQIPTLLMFEIFGRIRNHVIKFQKTSFVRPPAAKLAELPQPALPELFVGPSSICVNLIQICDNKCLNCAKLSGASHGKVLSSQTSFFSVEIV